MAWIPIALQLYSIRHECARDLPQTLAAVARMGYKGVEFAGYYDYPAAELKKMLDDNGLLTAGTHTKLSTLQGDQLQRTVEFNQVLGNKYLIVPSLPVEWRQSKASLQTAANTLNEIAAQLAPMGMKTGYHNHGYEFQPLEDGSLPWDTLFGNTNKEVVMQLDLGNALKAGADLVATLQRYPGRAATIHLKEFSHSNDQALIGEGDVPWSEVFRLCENTAGTEWYIVEQESGAYPPLECVEKCLDNLRAMGI